MENTLRNLESCQRLFDAQQEPEPLEGEELFLHVMEELRVKRLERCE